MSDTVPDPTYHNYLLTVWQEPRQDYTKGTRWRFLLSDPHSGKRYGFTNADGLLTALQQFSPAPFDLDETT